MVPPFGVGSVPGTHASVTGVGLGVSVLQGPLSGTGLGLQAAPDDEPLLPPLEDPPDPLPDPPPLLLPEDPPEPEPLPLLPPDTPLELPLPEDPLELPEPPSPPTRGALAPEHASAKNEASEKKRTQGRMFAGITLPWLGRLRY
jgi:hypothetical protein